MNLPEWMTALDGAVAVILVLAVARGVYNGLIRESFSLGAIAAAVVAVRYGTAPAASWIVEVTGGQIGEGVAPWIAGAVIGVAAIGLVGVAARLLRRGARFAGLGWADRLGGAALGAAEGTLVAMILVLGAASLIGRGHPAVAESRSLEAYDLARAYAEQNAERLPDVAAPGDW